MGKKVTPEKIIPEVVDYFCDACGNSMESKHHKDFVVTVSETGRDTSGAAVGGMDTVYELCGGCRYKFERFVKSLG